MDAQLVSLLGQWGIGGLFAWMWWTERRDRVAAEKRDGDNGVALAAVMQVVRDNTTVMTELVAEVRALREAQRAETRRMERSA